MNMNRLRGFLIFICCLFLLPVFSQTNTYILNGSATQNTCNCYTLTPAANFNGGSVWNANKISLNNPFDFVFNVFPGCTDANGADGIVFILQPLSTSIGVSGGGLGFQGIVPSIGIALDTWQNAQDNDPVYDHISIQSNGNINHANDLAGPIQASSTSDNIEDCQWHTFRISWDPATHLLRTYFDGVFRLEKTIDLVTTVFGNDPLVYWGFSAATGGSNNLQQFCTALNPGFSSVSSTNTFCIGSTVSFTNTSQSFAPVASFYWDFGDGTFSNVANPPPHNYAVIGNYEVKLVITALDGCISDTLRKMVAAGDFPIADFNVVDTCATLAPRISDLSTVTVGTVSQWAWKLDGTNISASQLPQLTGIPAGPHQLQLIATSNNGCASVPVTKNFTMKPVPVLSAVVPNGCVNVPLSFQAQQTDNQTTISSWNWQYGDGLSSGIPVSSHTFNTTGNYTALLSATSTNGCVTPVMSFPFHIGQVFPNAGNDTLVIQNVPFTLKGMGGGQYSWSPSTGLNDPLIANPVATLSDDITYTLTVTSADGCSATDEVNITVFKGSAIYVPTGFTPNNDGLNDRLKPYYVGIKEVSYFRIYNRWGQLVFSTSSLQGAWDGYFKGSLQAGDTFIWTLKATDFAGKVYDMKGSTTIIR